MVQQVKTFVTKSEDLSLILRVRKERTNSCKLPPDVHHTHGASHVPLHHIHI